MRLVSFSTPESTVSIEIEAYTLCVKQMKNNKYAIIAINDTDTSIRFLINDYSTYEIAYYAFDFINYMVSEHPEVDLIYALTEEEAVSGIAKRTEQSGLLN